MFLNHEPCPRCRERNQDRSGNNLGVWDDHKYCFSCGYYENLSLSIDNIKNKFQTLEKNKNDNSLPSDCTSNLRRDGLSWLKKYGLTDTEIQVHNVLWSESRELLVFPIVAGSSGMWLGRYFGGKADYPKYVTYGLKDGLHILGEKSSTIILVEDLISAIKVSRQFSCMPIFGSSISRRLLSRLQVLGFSCCAIWLDPDKAQEALKFCKIAEYFFERATTIVSDKDPKDYSDGEINGYVTKSLS